MYRQYQRKLAETVRDNYVPTAAHFAAITDILNGKEFTGFGQRSTANGTTRKGVYAILERARIVREYVCPVQMVTQILGEMSAPDIFKARNSDIRELKRSAKLSQKYAPLGRKCL